MVLLQHQYLHKTAEIRHYVPPERIQQVPDHRSRALGWLFNKITPYFRDFAKSQLELVPQWSNVAIGLVFIVSRPKTEPRAGEHSDK
jgi:hypothetical protein